MYHSLTIPRIVQICKRHHAHPEYSRDSVGVYCTIRDASEHRITSGYVHF